MRRRERGWIIQLWVYTVNTPTDILVQAHERCFWDFAHVVGGNLYRHSVEDTFKKMPNPHAHVYIFHAVFVEFLFPKTAN